MKRRTRIVYIDAQKAEMWDRWQNGETMHDIARSFDRHHTSAQRILTENGGIRPRRRKRSRLALTLAEREIISRGLAQQLTLRAIATWLGRSPSTISREIQRNGGYAAYRANTAEKAAWERALRPKPCKLASRPELVTVISRKLQLEWSPDQIAGWLRQRYPHDERYHVSHETIYKSLFIQARGVLKKELLAYLRTERTVRRPRQTTLKGKGLGQIPEAVSISERPASVVDRAAPGHWEGDLVAGSNENTNRLLRQYFPKGTDLSVHSQAELNRVARRLNERPRKTLDYETPADRFAACVASTD